MKVTIRLVVLSIALISSSAFSIQTQQASDPAGVCQIPCDGATITKRCKEGDSCHTGETPEGVPYSYCRGEKNDYADTIHHGC